jgi:hypothetical protein
MVRIAETCLLLTQSGLDMSNLILLGQGPIFLPIRESFNLATCLCATVAAFMLLVLVRVVHWMWQHVRATRFTETAANRNAVTVHVRYWPLADMDYCAAKIRFRG